MAKSRKPLKLVNFDGENLAMTRDVYEFSTRRRKTLLSRLDKMPELEQVGSDSFVYKDPRGQVFGFLSLREGELMVDSNSTERADRMSGEVLKACEGLLTFSRRAGHDEVFAESKASGAETGLVTDLDKPVAGLGKSMRELLEDPETLAQFQAQMPPGADLRTMLENPDDIGPFHLDDEEDEVWDGEVSDGFRTLGLRLDLLDKEKSGLYWMLKVPDWLTLGNLHRIFNTLLGRPLMQPFAYHFPYQSYDSKDKGETHPDLTTLRRAFQSADQGFYACGSPEWGFLLRRARVFSLCRGAVELVRTEVFPPGDCSTPSEYLQRLKAGSLPRSMPFELVEHRLQTFIDTSASNVGVYQTQGLNLPSLLVTILLARNGEPASIFELTHRAFLTDCSTEVTVSGVRRTTKKAPFVIEGDGRISLDPADPAYTKVLTRLRKFRAPEGPRLMVRRFTSQTMSVQGEPPDIVLVVDDGPGLVHGCQVCEVTDGVAPMQDAIQQALAKFPEAVAVVLDDPLARYNLQFELARCVEFSLSVDEPLDAFLALEKGHLKDAISGGYSYPSGLSQGELAEFCAAARRYYLLTPWVLLSDADVFEVVGLTAKPLIASIMGQAHEVYGLSLFEGKQKYQRFKDGDMTASLAFMDYLEAPLSERLREQASQAGVALIDDDTCPFAYGIRQPATPTQFRILTEVLNLVCDRVGERGEVEPGTTQTMDSAGRSVRITFPVGEELDEPPPGPSKLGRNDPCWCGSGKKYKKCHLGLDG